MVPYSIVMARAMSLYRSRLPENYLMPRRERVNGGLNFQAQNITALCRAVTTTNCRCPLTRIHKVWFAQIPLLTSFHSKWSDFIGAITGGLHSPSLRGYNGLSLK